MPTSAARVARDIAMRQPRNPPVDDDGASGSASFSDSDDESPGHLEDDRSRWLRVTPRSSKIRVGPEYQAVLPAVVRPLAYAPAPRNQATTSRATQGEVVSAAAVMVVAAVESGTKRIDVPANHGAASDAAAPPLKRPRSDCAGGMA